MRKEFNQHPYYESNAAAVSLAQLLHPSAHFTHPRDVLAADHIGSDEKRAILASWASDLFAIESYPSLRFPPGADGAVAYDDILEALKELDGQCRHEHVC